MNLKTLGWTKTFENKLKQLENYDISNVARVAAEYKGIYKLLADDEEILGEISDKMRYEQKFPVIGDWVVCDFKTGGDRAIIHEILPRKSKFSRNSAGDQTKEQIVAANIDTVFIVTSFNQDLNLRRLEDSVNLLKDINISKFLI